MRLWALAVLLVAGAATAGERTLVLDPARSEISFTLDATLHTVHGRLRLERGAIRFDPDGGTASGEILVDARSARTGSARRDRNMHRDVLESGRYPAIALRVERLEILRRDATSADVVLRGRLALHGSSHAVEVPARLRAVGDRVRIEAAFEVPYVAWGLKDVSRLLLRVADRVAVSVRAEGRLELPPSPRPEDSSSAPGMRLPLASQAGEATAWKHAARADGRGNR